MLLFEPAEEIGGQFNLAKRIPALDGIDPPKVVSYIDVIRGRAPVGQKVAIMGAGGIGFDVASNGREVTLLQRKTTQVGQGLGRTTGWAHRLTLQRRGVKMIAGVDYKRVDDHGLHGTIGDEPIVLNVDTVVVCAGQESARNLFDALIDASVTPHLIGGAFEASELDAKLAIQQATQLAVAL